MGRVFFGSVAQIVLDHILNTWDMKEVAGWLMCLPLVIDDFAEEGFLNTRIPNKKVQILGEFEEKNYFVPDSDKTNRCWYISNRTELIGKNLIKKFKDPDRYDLMVNRFTELISQHMDIEGTRTGIYDAVYAAINLIQSDYTISPRSRKLLLSGIEEASQTDAIDIDAVAEFFVKTMIYAVQQNPRIKEQKNSIPPNLDPVNVDFFSRSDYLASIEQSFASGSNMVILCGMSGVGKSQIALQYAHQSLTKYDIVWWITGDEEAAVSRDLSQFLRAKKIKGVDDQYADIRDAFLEALNNTTESYLLVYDNFSYESDSDYNYLKSLLPVAAKGHILVTTQTSHPFSGIKPIEVLPFTKAISGRFLQKKTGLKADQNALYIADIFGGHPLALDYAASYITANDIAYTDYLKLLRDRGISKMLAEKQRDVKTYQHTANAAFRITVDHILSNADSQEQRDSILMILIIWGHYLPRELPRKIKFDPDTISHMDKVYATFFTEENKLNTVLMILKGYSLVDITQRQISMHALTKAFASELMDQQEAGQLLLKICKGSGIAKIFSTDQLYVKAFDAEKEGMASVISLYTQLFPDYAITGMAGRKTDLFKCSVDINLDFAFQSDPDEIDFENNEDYIITSKKVYEPTMEG